MLMLILPYTNFLNFLKTVPTLKIIIIYITTNLNVKPLPLSSRIVQPSWRAEGALRAKIEHNLLASSESTRPRPYDPLEDGAVNGILSAQFNASYRLETPWNPTISSTSSCNILAQPA
jgi:hypothetical protein